MGIKADIQIYLILIRFVIDFVIVAAVVVMVEYEVERQNANEGFGISAKAGKGTGIVKYVFSLFSSWLSSCLCPLCIHLSIFNLLLMIECDRISRYRIEIC